MTSGWSRPAGAPRQRVAARAAAYLPTTLRESLSTLREWLAALR